MDGPQFDDLARGLAGLRSRRGALTTLLGGALGGVGVLVGAGRAGAAKPDKPAKPGKPDCCPPDYPTLCGLTCASTLTDANNCGACGNVCPSGSCVSGSCAESASCQNGVMDGTESDVDCGGVFCPPCPAGKQCITNSDCEGEASCENGICT